MKQRMINWLLASTSWIVIAKSLRPMNSHEFINCLIKTGHRLGFVK